MDEMYYYDDEYLMMLEEARAELEESEHEYFESEPKLYKFHVITENSKGEHEEMLIEARNLTDARDKARMAPYKGFQEPIYIARLDMEENICNLKR